MGRTRKTKKKDGLVTLSEESALFDSCKGKLSLSVSAFRKVPLTASTISYERVKSSSNIHNAEGMGDNEFFKQISLIR